MAVNAGPLGAMQLPLTDTLMTAAPAVRMSTAKPITSPTAHALPYAPFYCFRATIHNKKIKIKKKSYNP